MKLTYRVSTMIRWLVVMGCIVLLTDQSLAVTSKIHRHEAGPDLFNGQTDNVVIGSRGTLGLGRSAEVLLDAFRDVWSINCILTNGSTLYFGTSPNGGIYRYTSDQLTKIYPEDVIQAAQLSPARLEDTNDPEAYERISNEHVFAMTTDVAGRLVAGISGSACRLLRFTASGTETIYEPNDVKYIFSLTTDTAGNIYMGTGPEGKVFRLDPFGRTAQLLYDSRDKNILSLASGADGFVYAGSDSRGLIYKLNPRTQEAAVLYDSSQPEITALLFTDEAFLDQWDLYAIGTSAKVLKTETEFASQLPMPGRPDTENSEGKSPDSGDSAEGTRLKVANTKEEPEKPQTSKPMPMRKGQRPESPSYLYHIDKDGYVKDLARESMIFFCLTHIGEQLLVGTGNQGQLLSIDPDLEEKTILYEDKTSTQVTSLAVADQMIYLGLANPAKLIKLGALYASEGTYTSSLIDAGQPAHWGKLQIDADIPKGCKVLMESRTGNVEDVNDPTFSAWSDPVEVIEPIPLSSPLGRFCQYRLTLKSEDGTQTPVVREVVVASTIPNLPPLVEVVDVERIGASPKGNFYKIKYRARDHNDDQLIYTIYFRKVGRTQWIEMADQIETDSYDWNSLTVEDGRYEIRVLASDERSNSPATKMTGSRISDPVVVDNTGPVIRGHFKERRNNVTALILLVKDVYSVINKLMYTIDSHEDWQGAVPDDLVYDTTDESFTIIMEDLDPGEHVVAIQVSDDVGNITYQSFEVDEPEH